MKRFSVLAAAIAAVLSACPAMADGPRTVDFTAVVTVDGKPVVNDFKCPAGKDGKRLCETPYTAGEIAFLSLERPQDRQNWEDAIKRDDLARAIRAATAFPLLDDQKITIEQAAGPLWTPNLLAALRDAIDPRPATAPAATPAR